MTDKLKWNDARLRSLRDLTHDIRLFEIETLGAFKAPTPGSHLNIIIQIDGKPAIRSYSLVGPCTDGVYRIAVKRLPASRGGSTYMWQLAAEAQLKISEPANHFAPTFGQPEYLLLAGGIGITPIYTIALALEQAGATFRLLYAARTKSDLALAGELKERIGDRLEVFIGEAGKRIDINREIGALHSDGEVYVCGPITMMEACKRLWSACGRPLHHLRFETFGSSGHFASEPFSVSIPRLGVQVDVASNQSLLEALEQAGIDTLSDCRRGECGLCALPIVSATGTLDHRDVFFSESEKTANTKLCACVSRVVGGDISIDTGMRPS